MQTISMDIVMGRGSSVPLTIKNIPTNIPKIVATIFKLVTLLPLPPDRRE
jgi:hypothetical protein